MDLKWLLVRRITLVALACLAVGTALAIYRTAREGKQQNAELIDVVARQLGLQLSRIDRSTDLAKRFPDWDMIAGLTLQPGQCILLRGIDDSVRRSSCAGMTASPDAAPLWFVSAWRAWINDALTGERAIDYRGVPQGTVVAEVDAAATANRAWATIAPLIGFAAGLVAVLCLVTFFIISRALRPTAEILEGLNRLAQGDLAYRLPTFRLTELNRIGDVFNKLSNELSKATAERADLARRLVDAQEQERRHIARELHDEIAQRLSALNAHAACVRTMAQREAPQLTDDARGLEVMASELMTTLRRTLTYLRPQEIDDFGLVQSLEALVARHNEKANGRTSFSIETGEGIEHLGAETSAHVYRIVQEALTNASRHANARTVQVQLAQVPLSGRDTIRLSVVDDGAGATPDQKAASPSGAGLIGMRERVVALSGTIHAGPRAGGGFGLKVEFPTMQEGAQ